MSGKTEPKVFLCKDKDGNGAVPAAFEKIKQEYKPTASVHSLRYEAHQKFGEYSRSQSCCRCFLTTMGCIGDRIDAGYKYQNEMLMVYPCEQGVQLQHPSSCPCHFLTATDIANIPNKSQAVKAAVAVLLQTFDNQVLLTRRPEHMRTFPCVWVPPGGHIEPGETLYQACTRELSEETGLTFSPENLNISTLGLWESVYPPLLSMGLPVRHHVVVYLLAQAQEDHRTLQGRLNLHNQEVDAAAWIDEATATEVAASDDFGQSRKVPQRYFSASVVESSKLVEKNIPLSTLMTSVPSGSEPNKERLSAGAKFVLERWIKLFHPPPPGGF